MAGKSSINSFTANDFKTLLTAYVVPYQINQEIYQGVPTNHPVYIPLGLVLMLLNHSCTMYDSKKESTVQTPMVYVDFSTEHNFCLSNTKQLSTNPWVTLIPFEGGFEGYKKIFDPYVLDGNYIKPVSGSEEKISLFNPDTQDVLSPQLPIFKDIDNIYRGRVMNILLNIDYLVKLVKDYSSKDETNSIYLKTFVEQILSDLNRFLGNVNIFRLAYNDQGNTFHIVDDQVIPVKSGNQDNKDTEEEMLRPDNTTSLPVYGKFSIAKNLEIKTEISSKLSNMLAVSANADVPSKSTLSTNGDNFGYINTNYVDRYITNRKEINTGSAASYDTIINSSAQFNKTIYDFYSTINPSEASVGHATNYFIDRISKIKNEEYPTRASAMIPVSVNFTTDGISGLSMGQSFTIPDQLLPYTYNDRIIQNQPGLNKDHINKVGFVVVGLNHSLENNQWNTNVRANMIFLKNKTEFVGSVVRAKSTGSFGVDLSNPSQFIGKVSLGDLNINQNWEQIAFDFISSKEGFLDKPKPDQGTLRAGYGTDKIVLANGEIKSVGSDTVFTREDGKRTLIYQIKTTFAPKVISQIGQNIWDPLNDRQKAALVSFTYNVGSLTSVVVKAIKSNTGSTSVANAIASGPYTGRVSGYLSDLEKRRKQESTLYLS
jgi:GH24 family phage-related lysozyme (muramidase)